MGPNFRTLATNISESGFETQIHFTLTRVKFSFVNLHENIGILNTIADFNYCVKMCKTWKHNVKTLKSSVFLTCSLQFIKSKINNFNETS